MSADQLSPAPAAAVSPEPDLAARGSAAPSAPFKQRFFRSDAVRFVSPLLIAIIAIAIYTQTENSNFLGGERPQHPPPGVGARHHRHRQTFLIAAGQLDLSVAMLAALAGVIGATRIKDGGSELSSVLLVLLICAVIGLIWGLLVAGCASRRSSSRSAARACSPRWHCASRRAPPCRRGPVRLAPPDEGARAADPDLVLPGRRRRRGRRHALHTIRTTRVRNGVLRRGVVPRRHPDGRTKMLCFVISSTLAGFAGVVAMARIGAGDPLGGSALELRSIAAVVLGGATLAGGRGSPLGTFVGVVLLGVVQSALTFNEVDVLERRAVFGGVLIFAVVVTAIGDRRRASCRRSASARRPGPTNTAARRRHGSPLQGRHNDE